MTKPLQTYEAPGIVVTFDPNICRHAGVCVHGLPAVFDIKRKRWVQPELATPEEVAEQVARCPSGALHYRLTPPPDPRWKRTPRRTQESVRWQAARASRAGARVKRSAEAIPGVLLYTVPPLLGG